MSANTSNNETKYEVLYIVTQYGCNSTPSEMWPPETDVFTDYEKAYKRFLGVSPCLNDEDNRAERTVHTEDIHNVKIEGYTEGYTEGYRLIESRVQVPGYYDGDGTCAKRPEGAVIARLVKKREQKMNNSSETPIHSTAISASSISETGFSEAKKSPSTPLSSSASSPFSVSFNII